MTPRLDGFRGGISSQVPLARRTTWRIGGPAAWLLQPADLEDLAGLLARCDPATPRLLLGGGSNLLLDDAGFAGWVIDLAPGLERIALERADPDSPEVLVRVEAGVALHTLAHWARRRGLAGCEFLAGIPGRLGGAVVMNAGAYGGQLSELLCDVTLLSAVGELSILTREELGLGYRSSGLPAGAIVCAARLRLTRDDPGAILERIRGMHRRRVAAQPLALPSAGSTFKNPPGGPAAWELLAAAGLRGARIGAAQVAEKHCNFFLNLGGCSSREMLELITTAMERVAVTSGKKLVPEVKLLGPRGEFWIGR